MKIKGDLPKKLELEKSLIDIECYIISHRDGLHRSTGPARGIALRRKYLTKR
jgi:hypothetical protein